MMTVGSVKVVLFRPMVNGRLPTLQWMAIYPCVLIELRELLRTRKLTRNCGSWDDLRGSREGSRVVDMIKINCKCVINQNE